MVKESVTCAGTVSGQELEGSAKKSEESGWLMGRKSMGGKSKTFFYGKPFSAKNSELVV